MSDVKPSKRRGWARFISFLLIALLAGTVGGFIAFAQHVDGLRAPSAVPVADGIVVWTGAGGGRLEAGAKLLSAKKGERLLISGVNTDNETAQIVELIQLPEDLADCCLDLDYAAENTIGNARETAVWARALGYEHIILVTSAYHMPRANVEIAGAAGRMRITPFPVARSDSQVWYKSQDRAELLLREYGKYLVALARGRQGERAAPDIPLEN